MDRWFVMLLHYKKVLGLRPGLGMWPFCVEFVCSPNLFWVLRFLPTVHKDGLLAQASVKNKASVICQLTIMTINDKL